VDSICTDFSKVFDKVRHRLLLDKMSTDVELSRCQWLGSYFSGRIQRVKMGDCVSRNILVTSGVPQGSHLRPLCFIWFVNEISPILRHVQVLFYADDMELLLLVRGFRACLKF
jgi:retron-type reverse transcriptase